MKPRRELLVAAAAGGVLGLLPRSAGATRTMVGPSATAGNGSKG